MIAAVASMELHLGLALPGTPPKDFDLNSQAAEPRHLLPSKPSDQSPWLHGSPKKRGFDSAFDEESSTSVPRTLSLLHWNKNPDDEDDPDNHLNENDNDSADSNTNGVVGWPPVKRSWKKKLCHKNHGRGTLINNLTMKNGYCGCSGGAMSNANSTYVKVMMEGVAIGRKVDLSLYNSLQMLTDTLMDMFGKRKEDSKGYGLAYQDREGDWLLAQDVPWRSLVGSAQRLKLLRSTQ